MSRRCYIKKVLLYSKTFSTVFFETANIRRKNKELHLFLTQKFQNGGQQAAEIVNKEDVHTEADTSQI